MYKSLYMKKSSGNYCFCGKAFKYYRGKHKVRAKERLLSRLPAIRFIQQQFGHGLNRDSSCKRVETRGSVQLQPALPGMMYLMIVPCCQCSCLM